MLLQADAVLQEFLQRREALDKNILNIDLALEKKDKELKGNLWAGEMSLPVDGQAWWGAHNSTPWGFGGLSSCLCNTSLSPSPDVQQQYEKAQQEWDARWKQEAEDKQKLQDKLHSTEEEVARLRKKLEDQPKKRREEHPKTSKRKSKVRSGRVQVPRRG